ncbi:P22_AR_N domain containing protein [Laribacter hongkongensis]|uniref:P22_AR_N domain containing protein n=2 Tax=Laribacter hongkongensis TaxID=168471 RepID=A0A248LIV3_9NEIS|nr:P22_AR_N domain containing protein [Laribacter hongkongensis]
MVCLPLRKLPAWLYSINHNKVKPELQDKIVRYQNE